MFAKFATALVLATVAIVPASAAVTITVEQPNVVNTTQNGTFAVQTFDSASAGFVTNFSDTVGSVGFSYVGVDIRAADQFGGVGGSQYAATYNGLNFAPYDASAGSYTLTPTYTGGPLNYFGAYFTAQDSNNSLRFFKNGSELLNFAPSLVINNIDTAAYTTGGLVNVFVNVFFTAGDTYDQVVFSAAGTGTGFESDNHTIGTFIPPITGDLISGAIPEPATWAMLLAGFGMVGFAARRRRALAA